MSVFSPSRSTNRPSTAGPAQGGQLSVLAHGLHVTGEIQSDGIVTIEGRLDGVIRGTPRVFVAPGGVVVGDVSANEVVVAGRIEGNVDATTRVELQAGAMVQGDVTTPRIVVHEGSEVNGRFRMQRPATILPIATDQLRLSA
jgi:cytoskeletal protein CcmA (bactofilin family)